MNMMPPAQPHMCATCLAQRIQWELAHPAEMQRLTEAVAAAQQAAAAGKQPPDLTDVMPDGMPQVQPSVTTVQGTECCAQHIPGLPGSRPPLLAVQGALSHAMLGQLAGSPS